MLDWLQKIQAAEFADREAVARATPVRVEAGPPEAESVRTEADLPLAQVRRGSEGEPDDDDDPASWGVCPSNVPTGPAIAIESRHTRGAYRKAADFRREARGRVLALRLALTIFGRLSHWRRVVGVFIAEADRRERLPKFKWIAGKVGLSPRQVRRILDVMLEIAERRRQGRLDLRKLLRPSEWTAYRLEFLRRIREGLDPRTGEPPAVEPGQQFIVPIEQFARKWSADLDWLRWLCDTFGEIAARTGTDRAGRLADAIAPLMGAGRRNRLEAVWAALVIEHVRQRSGGRLPFKSADLVIEHGTEPIRLLVINDVAVLCGLTIPGCRLNIRVPMRDDEPTGFPAMGRRIQKRVDRLPPAGVRRTYQRVRLLSG